MGIGFLTINFFGGFHWYLYLERSLSNFLAEPLVVHWRTTRVISSRARSISCSVVYLPTENRRVPMA